MLERFTDGNEFVEEYLANKQYVFLTSSTAKYSELTYNWYLSLKQINLESNSLVVAHDKYCYRKLQSWGVPSVFLECNLPDHFSSKQWIEIEKETKLLSLYLLYKKFSCDFVFSDTDIIFLKNPYTKFLDMFSEDWYHIIAMSDKVFQPFHLKRKFGKEITLSEDFGEAIDYGVLPQHSLMYQINAGFSFLPNTATCEQYKYDSKDIKTFILDFIKVFYKNSTYFNKFPIMKESGCLQVLTNHRYAETNTKVKLVSNFDFVNGSLWKVPYLREYVKDKCYLIHYNFSKYLNPSLSLKDKVSQIKSDGFWFL